VPEVAIYAGTFDPVTYGHLDLVQRALRIFRRVILAVAHNPGKEPLFSVAERVDMLRQVTGDLAGVEVDSFDGLLVHYARSRQAKVIIRGLRALSEFEHEFRMALSNRKLDSEVETIFLMPSEIYSYLSSALIKEIVTLGGHVSEFVPALVEEKLRGKLGQAGT